MVGEARQKREARTSDERAVPSLSTHIGHWGYEELKVLSLPHYGRLTFTTVG